MLKRAHGHPYAVRWTTPRLGFGDCTHPPGNPPETRVPKHRPATHLIAQNAMV
jgi:hypothetical protein